MIKFQEVYNQSIIIMSYYYSVETLVVGKFGTLEFGSFILLVYLRLFTCVLWVELKLVIFLKPANLLIFPNQKLPSIEEWIRTTLY